MGFSARNWRPWREDRWRDPGEEKSRSRSPSGDRTVAWISDRSTSWSARMVRDVSGNHWSSHSHRDHYDDSDEYYRGDARTDWDSRRWDEDDKWKEQDAWEQRDHSWDSHMSEGTDNADSFWPSKRDTSDDTDLGGWYDYENKSETRDADSTESNQHSGEWWGPYEDSSGEVWWDGMKYHGWDYQTIFHHDMILQYGTSKSKMTLFFLHSCAHCPQDIGYYLNYFWDFGLDKADVRIVAPCSPRRQFPENYEGNTWFDYTTDRSWQNKQQDAVDHGQFLEQRERLLELLEDEHRRLPEGGMIVLAGLSQGASLAADLLLHAPAHIDSIAGLWCSRGLIQQESPGERDETGREVETFLGERDLDWQVVSHRARTVPVFVYHGKADTTVPWKIARKSYLRLKNYYKFKVTMYAEEDIHHATESLQEYSRVAKFLYQVFHTDRNAGREGDKDHNMGYSIVPYCG